MTPGEMMIYAAVFAKEANGLRNPPNGICTPGREADRTQWEQDQIAGAAELASSIVEYYRKAGTRIKEGWGKDSKDYQMFLSITGQTP